ncbi:hypothetical protein [Oceanidesulfovibrio marinus]|uniref:EF-hand domain-containing protein n=1 Tax=Oceanidesulfovibrio marinus TaxID=370038 RepID=A0ABX6NLU6_9BACT|nr:hypothetical protein [Oceanidesulfovibrio marinus]QJT10595.1 hypothetical protein E8L03_17460 [Oceanidesulfovibrio marinus]
MPRLLPHITLCLGAALLLLAVHTAWAQRIGRFRAIDADNNGVITAAEFDAVCNFSGQGFFAQAAGEDGALSFAEYDAWLERVHEGSAPDGNAWSRHFTCHP